MSISISFGIYTIFLQKMSLSFFFLSNILSINFLYITPIGKMPLKQVENLSKMWYKSTKSYIYHKIHTISKNFTFYTKKSAVYQQPPQKAAHHTTTLSFLKQFSNILEQYKYHQYHQKHQAHKMNHSFFFAINRLTSHSLNDQENQSPSIQCWNRKQIHNTQVCR